MDSTMRCPCCEQVLSLDSAIIENERWRAIIQNGKVVRFSPTQWAIWRIIRSAPDGVEGEALFARIYGILDVGDNNLSVQISHMRKKLKVLDMRIITSGWGGRANSGRRAIYRVVKRAS